MTQQSVNVPPVIVVIPPNLGPVEILVRHEDHGVEVDVRPAGTAMSWTPIHTAGGRFLVRAS